MGKVICSIAGRLESERFPNKLLAEFQGKPIIEHAIEIAKRLDFVDEIVMLTADEELMDIAAVHNIRIFDVEARNACEKIYKFYKENPYYEMYISLTADEPLINPMEIERVWNEIGMLGACGLPSTLYSRFYNESDLRSPLSCKIVTSYSGRMLYNSRNVIPVGKDGKLLPLRSYKKHVGVFFFPQKFLKDYGDEIWCPSLETELDVWEGLEQNRFPEMDYEMHMVRIDHVGFGIDIPSQIEKLEGRTVQVV